MDAHEAIVEESLSASLRAQTAPLHAEVELLLGLPDVVQGKDDYGRLLGRFFGLYEPLERSFHLFDEWRCFGVDLANRNHSSCLVSDLLALGTDLSQVPRAPESIIPELPTFAHALGAFYVLEGSVLGGRMILRDLEARVGQQFAGATHFLGGRGEETAPMWKSFRAALDSFGRAKPQRRGDVLVGADRVFRSLLIWFTPFPNGAERS
jgi:heme oxygenase